jgi:hypothetical protein
MPDMSDQTIGPTFGKSAATAYVETEQEAVQSVSI